MNQYFAESYTDLMSILNDLPSPLRQKVMKSIQVALNNLILCENGANITPATATKSCRVVLNKTAMEAVMMEQNIETPIISAISIPSTIDLYFDAWDGVEDIDYDNDNKHVDIDSARSHAPQHCGLQLDDDVKIKKDENENENKDENEDEDEDKDTELELVDNCEGESSLENMLQVGCNV